MTSIFDLLLFCCCCCLLDAGFRCCAAGLLLEEVGTTAAEGRGDCETRESADKGGVGAAGTAAGATNARGAAKGMADAEGSDATMDAAGTVMATSISMFTTAFDEFFIGVS